jgi:hypothetical protein
VLFGHALLALDTFFGGLVEVLFKIHERFDGDAGD